jgi:hypothetical protein
MSKRDLLRKFFDRKIARVLGIIALILILILTIYHIFAYKSKPDEIKYGMSFNVPYAQELGLDWKKAFIDTMDDLGVERLRLAAHWTLVEPEKDQYDFSYLDYQLEESNKRGVDVIFAVGRRLPRWPECHVPEWADMLSWEEQKEELREYIKLVVERYERYDNIIYWQVENEPYLEVFAYAYCGDLDEDFLKEEIQIVRDIDDTRPILITDSGNIGSWAGPYSNGDVFGTSVYLYFWNPFIGQFKSILPSSFYRFKDNMMEAMYGPKDSILVELSLEPWLIQPIVKTPIQTQLDVMGLDRVENIIKYAEKTRFEYQYLWGGEWWYWLKEKHGIDEYWEFGEELFR